MTTTVGRNYRKKMFSWIRANEDVMFRSDSDARVLLLHSSASRDYIDGLCIMSGQCGVSLFATWARPDPTMAWWTPEPTDSLYASNYMAEYRGMVKALVDHHVPFDLMPSRLLTGGLLSGYDVVVAPSLEALSDGENLALSEFVSSGGKLIFTGARPGGLTEKGLVRPAALFPEINAAAPGTCSIVPVGAGEMVWCNQSLGKNYMVNDDPAAFMEIGTQLGNAKDAVLQTDASTGLYFEVYSTANNTAVHAVNYKGANGTFSVIPATFNLTVETGTKSIRRVVQTSPAFPDPVELAFVTMNGKTTFKAENVGTWTLFIVEYY